jgi:hypothetical protein
MTILAVWFVVWVVLCCIVWMGADFFDEAVLYSFLAVAWPLFAIQFLCWVLIAPWRRWKRGYWF